MRKTLQWSCLWLYKKDVKKNLVWSVQENILVETGIYCIKDGWVGWNVDETDGFVFIRIERLESTENIPRGRASNASVYLG